MYLFKLFIGMKHFQFFFQLLVIKTILFSQKNSKLNKNVS